MATSDLPAWIPETAPGTGRTFWVATNGSDSTGDGSFENPWRTINHAASQDVSAGDEIVVRPGTYVEQVYIWRGGWNDGAGGFEDGQLTIRSEVPGEAQIRPPEGAYSTVLVRANNVTLEGFDIVGGEGHGIDVESAAYTVVRDNVVHDSGGSGIQFNYSEFIVIEGNTTFGNAGTNGWHTSGISVYQNRNITGDTETAGFRTIVRDNISYNNITQPVVQGDHTDGNGIIIDDFQSTQTAGFPNYTFPTLVENNLTFGNGSKGIQVTWSDYVTVRGNTAAYNNVDDLNLGTWRGELSNQQSSHNTWTDNIAVTNPAFNAHNTAIGNYSYGGYVNENVVWENNLTFNGTPGQASFKVDGGNNAPLAADGNLLGVDPQFLDAPAFDFRLDPDSPAFGLGWGGVWSGDDLTPEEPVAEEPPAEEPVTEDPPPEEPVTEEPPADPAPEEPVAEEPPADPTPEEPVAEEPPADPTPEEPAPEDPDVLAFRAYWQGLVDAGRVTPDHAADVLELFEEARGDAQQSVYLDESQAPFRMWAFENDDKAIVFMSAGATPPGELTFDLSAVDTDLISLWAEGVENGEGYMATPDPAVPGSGAELSLNLDQPFEMVRLAFAKTARGEEEIALWSDAPQIDLSVFAQEAPAEAPASGDDADDDAGLDDDDDDDDDDGGFSFGPELAAGLALFSILFLFA